MSITDRLVLPGDAVLTAADELPEAVRSRAAFQAGEFTLSRPAGRAPSRVVDARGAELVRAFREPATIVEAVLRLSAAQGLDPEATLAEAYPLLANLVEARLLVPADAADADAILPTLVPGARMGGWEVVRCVQALEDTELYLARRGTTWAALKAARPGAAPEPVRLLAREGRLLRRAAGTAAPAWIADGEEDGRPWLAMEWCAGVDAWQAARELREAGAPRTALLPLCLAILDAYAALHARGVVHADVHPRNLLVDADGRVRIVDFGLAWAAGETEPARGGIAYFYAPEYAASLRLRTPAAPADEAGEQYALAVVVYLLLTGGHPADFSVERDAMLLQVESEPPLPFAARGAEPWPEGEAVLARALAKAPGERFPDVSAFAEALRRAGATADAAPVTATLPVSTAAPAVASGAREAERVLARLGMDGALADGGLPIGPTASINYGAGGIAYGLLRVSYARDDAALLSLAELWCTRAERELASPGALENRGMGITAETVGAASPLHGASGVHAVRALLARATGDEHTLRRALPAFVAASHAASVGLDLTLGRTATVLGCSLLVEALGREPSLLGLGDGTLGGVWERLDGLGPVGAAPEVPYLGVAHGWAGILYATLRWCRAAGRPLPARVGDRLAQLAACAEPAGRGVRWRIGVRAPAADGRDYMGGWCNGSAGMVHLWTLAEQVYGGCGYLDLARAAAWDTWETPGTVAQVCCGLAGQAYALLNLHRATGEAEWLRRATVLAERAAAWRGPPQPYAHSLYKGDVGVAVLAAEMEAGPGQARMPWFEHEGWPDPPASAPPA